MCRPSCSTCAPAPYPQEHRHRSARASPLHLTFLLHVRPSAISAGTSTPIDTRLPRPRDLPAPRAPQRHIRRNIDADRHAPPPTDFTFLRHLPPSALSAGTSTPIGARLRPPT